MEIEDEPVRYWRPESVVTLFWVTLFLLFLADVIVGIVMIVVSLNPFSPIIIAVGSVLIIYNLVTFGFGVVGGLFESRVKSLSTYMWLKGLYLLWMYVLSRYLSRYLALDIDISFDIELPHEPDSLLDRSTTRDDDSHTLSRSAPSSRFILLCLFIGYTIYIMVRRDQNNTSSTALNEFLSFIYTVAYGVVFVIYLFFGVRIYLSIN